jgi:hypothetical protein
MTVVSLLPRRQKTGVIDRRFRHEPHAHVIRLGFGRWQWSITDGLAGPARIGPHPARFGLLARSRSRRAHRKAKGQ